MAAHCHNGEKRSRLYVLREFCANTTSHGLARVAAATTWPARVFWMAIFLFAFVSAFYHISSNVQFYLKYPTKTDVFLVSEEELHFPGVTVCNLNPFKRSKVINLSLVESIVTVSEYAVFVHYMCHFVFVHRVLKTNKNSVNY